jgi:pumilio RNA-binding family
MRDIYVDKIANQIVQKCLEVLDGTPLLKLLKILSQYVI